MPHSFPPDHEALRLAVFEIARRVIRAEETPGGGGYPREPVELPPLPGDAPLAGIAARARLGEEATTLLRFVVAAELDRHVARVVQRLGGSPGQAGLPADGLLTLVEFSGGDPAAALAELVDDAPLLRRGLLQPCSSTGPGVLRRVRAAPRLVVCARTGEPPPDPLAPALVTAPPLSREALCPLSLRDEPGDALSAIERLVPRVLDGEPLWLCGPRASGRRTAVATAFASAGHRVLCLDAEAALRIPVEALVPVLQLERALAPTVLCVRDLDERSVSAAGGSATEGGGAAPVDDRRVERLVAALSRERVPVVYTAIEAPLSTESGLERAPHVLRLSRPGPERLLPLWRRELPETPDLDALASRFRLAPGRVVRAAQAARALGVAHGRTPSAADVARAISVQVSQTLALVGSLVEDTQSWDDLVLSPETLEAVRELLSRARLRHRVLEEWGFRRKLSKGVGLTALFAGPPGTGKTMVAGLVARELGHELYQVDLSRVVSKWVGETEKNLARVFDAAEGANVLLLFDESDSLFSKRTSEVRGASDRHANAEINYLLQRMERFEGISILTTNLESAIDPAFKRRLAFRLQFPMPEQEERVELWRRMLPTAAPVAGPLDLAKLARSYELSGGHIKNAVLRAAYLAAGEDASIAMRHLDQAVKLEYRDAGKLTAGGRMT